MKLTFFRTRKRLLKRIKQLEKWNQEFADLNGSILELDRVNKQLIQTQDQLILQYEQNLGTIPELRRFIKTKNHDIE